MGASARTIRTFWGAQVLLLAATLAGAVLFAHASEWHPAALVILLLVLALGGEFFTIEVGDGIMSASLAVMVLGVGLRGPGPPAACGAAAIGVISAVRRRPAVDWPNNLAAFAVAAFAGGMFVRAATGGVAGVHGQSLAQSFTFALVLLGGVVVLLAVNYLLFGLE